MIINQNIEVRLNITLLLKKYQCSFKVIFFKFIYFIMFNSFFLSDPPQHSSILRR